MKVNKINKTLAILLLSVIIAQPVFSRKLENENKNGGTKSVNAAGCLTPTARAEMALNNVRALIFTGGDMWWDLQTNAKYEIPKGSGKTSLFCGAIWIGGTDASGQYRVAGARFRSYGTDYFSGPLISNQGTTTLDECLKWDKHFRITRNEVAEFRSWWRAKQENNTDLLNTQFANYAGTPSDITNYPAINTNPLYERYLAPFHDENEDGNYNPDDGDYPYYDLDKTEVCGTSRDKRKPRLYGDETLWWVYNDRGNIHTESKGKEIGMEIRAQYFAFATNDELNNMTFGNYALINRSTYTLQDCYFGIWTDGDLGFADDDYVGTDVARGLGYIYNADEMDGDGNGHTYGAQPPAVGIDFFEGPYMDAYVINGDTLDRGTCWANNSINCNSPYIFNGSINGLNFGDNIPNNERWGMRRFMYHINSGGVQGDPVTAVEYYNYLLGFWKNGTPATYGGTGIGGTTPSNFMYPDDTDPCGWGTGTSQAVWKQTGTPYDLRIVQSAGPFTLTPGMTNDITTGMVWARATSGGAWASVQELKRADDKAQRLFDVCFKIVDGPNAPELKIIELDKELVFHIYNIKGSNNYQNTPEDYKELDPFIVCPTNNSNCDKYFTFQGYQVFQLKDETCSVTDIENADKARLVFQSDVKDSVSRIINFEYDNQLGVSVPKLKVDGANKGIQHTFTLTDDFFATGDKRLVNHKTYYYVAIAYGHNNYKTYNPEDPNALDGQKKPYLPSRSGVSGAVATYAAIPHNTSPTNDGTILNSDFGEGPKIIQLEGHGNGNNELRVTQNTINKIMAGSPWKADSIEYENGFGPFKIKVIDPLNVPAKSFGLKFDSCTVGTTNPYINYIQKAKWIAYAVPALSSADTVYSDSWISYLNEQIITNWGISITFQQVPWPCKDDASSFQNGYISSYVEWSDPKNIWATFIPDVDGCGFPNWIRSGTQDDAANVQCNDFPSTNGTFTDKDQYFEKVINGTWGPYALCMKDYSAGPTQQGVVFHKMTTFSSNDRRLSSIRVVITADKTKWSRCPVIEMAEYDPSLTAPGLSEGGQFKFGIRKHASIDKNGVTTNLGDTLNEASSNYIAAEGMGWFPGYAIDLETGERLNIAYGEDSHYPGQNGADMMWNPTNNYASNVWFNSGGTLGDLYLGGKHVIYVFGHNKKPTDTDYMPAYDYGKHIHDKLTSITNETGAMAIAKRKVWINAMWVSYPTLSTEVTMQTNPTDPYYFIKSDVAFNISVANPYQQSVDDLAVDSANVKNNNLPLYYFSLKDLVPVKNDNATAKSALDLIRVVPNPYYGYSGYEKSQLDFKVKITNLPQKCTISIYNISGTLIRRFKKDSELSYQDWDLKNEYSITIASGVYIVHVDAPGIGEKIIKWFGALRPIDLNNF